MMSVPTAKAYLDQPNRSQKVMLKVVKVLLHNGVESYGNLCRARWRLRKNHCSTTGCIATSSHQAARGPLPQDDPARGCRASWRLSELAYIPTTSACQEYKVSQAFTADSLSMVEHSYPVAAIQKCYEHLRGLPLPPVDHARPLLLIGLDMPHLLTPIQPVHAGPSGAPVAICTKFGWTL